MGTIGIHGGIVIMVINVHVYILWLYNVHFVHVRTHVQKILCLHNVHVFMYMFLIMVMKVHFGPYACIQPIRVICVTRTRKRVKSDTNEIIQSGNIIM